MIDAGAGFALLGAIVLAGWAVRRWGGLPGSTEEVLGRVAYLVLAPCLLFTGTADADLRLLVSGPLLVSALAAVVCFAVFAAVFARRDRGTVILGALAAGYTNANYLGIPIATHVLGDASLVVPVVCLQLLILTPLALVLLETTAAGRRSWRVAALSPARNPLVVAVTLGAVVNASGVRLPAVLTDPVATIGQATVPIVLLAFGMSLSGRGVLAPGPERLPTVVAVLLKTAGMPVVAFLLAVALDLSREATYTVTILAGLPAAQNLHLYAQRAGTAQALVRDAILMSTAGCLPVMLAIVVLLAP